MTRALPHAQDVLAPAAVAPETGRVSSNGTSGHGVGDCSAAIFDGTPAVDDAIEIDALHTGHPVSDGVHDTIAQLNPVVPVRAFISGDARREVLWCGRANIDLLAALSARRYRVSEVSLDLASVAVHLVGARAIVIEVPDTVDDALPWAGHIVELALMHGLAVAFCMASHEADQDVSDVPLVAVTRFTDAVASCKARWDFRVRVEMGKWQQLADWLVTQHDAGPSANMHLVIDGSVPTEGAAVTLLQRAFADYGSISLTQLQGGKSGAGVWLVEPTGDEVPRRALPFIAKFNTLQKTRSEGSSYALYADGMIPFNLRPPLHRGRCVEGADHGLLVFDFLARAIPFADALPMYTPGQLIGSLFGHTLAAGLRAASDRCSSLAVSFEQLKVLRWSPDLEEAAAVAREREPQLPDAGSLRTMVNALPAIMHRVATAHGDLHTGNLFVAAGSSDVLLIDFGSIAYGMPVGTDAACLEVSVTFAPADVRVKLKRCAPAEDAEWLRTAYQFPLEPFAVPERAGRELWLAHTVRATRAMDRQYEANPIPYAFAVASYLIRFASYKDNGSSADRALAYELACGLFTSIQQAVPLTNVGTARALLGSAHGGTQATA